MTLHTAIAIRKFLARAPCIRAVSLPGCTLHSLSLTTILSSNPAWTPDAACKAQHLDRTYAKAVRDVLSSLHNLTTLAVAGEIFRSAGPTHVPPRARSRVPQAFTTTLVHARAPRVPQSSRRRHLAPFLAAHARDDYALHELGRCQNKSLWDCEGVDLIRSVHRALARMLRGLEVRWEHGRRRAASIPFLTD